MARVVVINGGNVGDMVHSLKRAEELISERAGEIVERSSIYSSPAWGFSSQDRFLNQVLVFQTDLEPEALLDVLQGIERELGRNRKAELKIKEQSGEPYTSRSMDIDILLIDDRVISTERLKVPHPHIAKREFVLRPLAEVMPHYQIPLLRGSLQRLLKEVGTQEVEKVIL